MQKLTPQEKVVDYVKERTLSSSEKKKKEEIVMKLKKKTAYFKEKHGDRWKEVMYATATKMAKNEQKEIPMLSFKDYLSNAMTLAEKDTAYQEFFKKALKKFGVTEPDQLTGEKKKAFFDYVDKNWKAKKETD